MRIRTQLLVAIAVSVTLGLLAAGATLRAAHREDAANAIQTHAQLTAHAVSGLLIHTQEYARHTEPRAAQQWHQRHAAISAALAHQGVHKANAAALDELRSATRALPQLFVRLEEIADRDDAFSLRRKEALLDQLLSSIQAMSDNALQWHQDATQARNDAQGEFRAMALATPIATLAMMVALAVMTRKRVLLPIKQLGRTAAAVGEGDLSVRIASVVPDEIGDLSRRFDAMTTALQRSGEQVRRSEMQLRAIADNIPALVGHFDAQQRCLFANDLALRMHGIAPADATHHTLRSGIGEENYALHEPHVRKVLQGEACRFEGTLRRKDRQVHFQAHLVPEFADDGSVAGFYLMTFDVTALKTIEEQLHALARFDTLTGLPNRLQFNEKLPEALRRCERSERALALLFLDIDHFKAINDTLGHPVGDAVLKEFASRLARSVRATDTVARLAGDEFVVVLEGLHGDAEPQVVARKIIAQVARPITVAGRSIDVTTSVGIAVHDARGVSITPEALLKRADDALYQAKRAGRNTFSIAQTLMTEESR